MTDLRRKRHSRSGRVALLVAAVALAVATPAAPVGATTTTLAPCAAPEFATPQTLTYDTVNNLQMTAYVPSSTTPRAAIVLVEGADFGEVLPILSNTGSLLDCVARFLAAEGWAVFAPGYRGMSGATWPALPYTDVQNAVSWLREPAQVTEFALDSSRFGALGTSAGGLIAGLLGAPTTDSASRVQTVVTWSGPMDLTAEPIVPPSQIVAPNVLWEVFEIIPQLIGCEPYVADTVNDTWIPQPSCLDGAAAAASPLRQVGAGFAPMLLANAAWEGALVGMGDCTATTGYTPPPIGCFGIPSPQASTMGTALTTAGIPNLVDVVSDPTLAGVPCNNPPSPIDTMHVEYAACEQTVWNESFTWFQTHLPVGDAAPPGGPGGPGAPPAQPVVAQPAFTG